MRTVQEVIVYNCLNSQPAHNFKTILQETYEIYGHQGRVHLSSWTWTQTLLVHKGNNLIVVTQLQIEEEKN